MLAAWYERGGPAREVLSIGEMDAPRPGPGEVLVRLRASGINPGEIKKRADWMGFGIGYPRVIPHSDGAGTIEEVGEGISSSRVGQRVWVWGTQSGRPFGYRSPVHCPSPSAGRPRARRDRLRGGGCPRHPGSHGPPLRLRRRERLGQGGVGVGRCRDGGRLRRLVR